MLAGWIEWNRCNDGENWGDVNLKIQLREVKGWEVTSYINKRRKNI